MLTRLLFNPGTLITAIVLLALIVFIVVPDWADYAAIGFQRASHSLRYWVAVLWGLIVSVWCFSREKRRQQRRIDRAVQAEVARRCAEKVRAGRITSITIPPMISPEELAEIIEEQTAMYGGAPKYPEVSEIVQAWVRRIMYLILVLVCTAFDYVLASFRTPLLFGGRMPPTWLIFLLHYQIFTIILFVSISLLSGMIIQEFIDQYLADVVKLSPHLNKPWPLIFLSLAVFMFICDIVVIVSLTIAGIDFIYLLPVDVSLLFVIFVGMAIIISLAIFIGSQGLLDSIMGLGSLTILGSLALVITALGLVSGFTAAIFSLLGVSRRSWYARRSSVRSPVSEVRQEKSERSERQRDHEEQGHREAQEASDQKHAQEPVALAAYYPQAVAPRTWEPLLVYLSLDNETALRTVAADADEYLAHYQLDRFRVALSPQVATLPRHTELTIRPVIPGFRFNPVSLPITWEHDVQRHVFEMYADTALTGHAADGSVLIFRGEIPLIFAEIPLSIFVQAPDNRLEILATSMRARGRRYDKVFPSYSRKDKPIVDLFRSCAEASGNEFLQDVIALRSGERWEPQVESFIDRAQIFQLFWSRFSARSSAVNLEVEYALRHHSQREGFIRPVYWSPELHQPIPEKLKDIEFAYFDLGQFTRTARRASGRRWSFW